MTMAEKCKDCEAEVTDAVVEYSQGHYNGDIYCFTCQQKKTPPSATTPTDTASGSKSWQDDIVNFETLLNKAHGLFKGRLNISTELLEKDMEKKYAIVKATVLIDIGTDQLNTVSFEAHGDATDDNVGTALIKPHFIRMAETRAIARALRWATNNAAMAEEETQ